MCNFSSVTITHSVITALPPLDKPVNLPTLTPPGARTRHNRQAPSSALPINHPATAACKQPLHPGPCKARIPRFYFDNEQQRCLPFKFGGCHGNKNNFHTRKECEEQCPSHISGTKPFTDSLVDFEFLQKLIKILWLFLKSFDMPHYRRSQLARDKWSYPVILCKGIAC